LMTGKQELYGHDDLPMRDERHGDANMQARRTVVTQ
jgi:hypothetical protein